MPEIAYSECSNCFEEKPHEEICEHNGKLVCTDCYEELIQEEQDEELGKRKD